MLTSIHFESLLENLADALMIADPEGTLVYWNPACERIFGFSQSEAIGQSMDLIIPERQRGRHWEGYAKTMATGVTRYGTSLLRVPALHKSGHTLSIAFTVSLLYDAEQNVSHIAAVVRDETARFQEERALKQKLVELENLKK